MVYWHHKRHKMWLDTYYAWLVIICHKEELEILKLPNWPVLSVGVFSIFLGSLVEPEKKTMLKTCGVTSARSLLSLSKMKYDKTCFD